MTTSVKLKEMEFIQGLTDDLSSPELIFPTSLQTTMNIRHALLQENMSNETLARVISTEPVLSAQILKLGNSAAFNTSGKMTSQLSQATMRLGFSKVRNLTIYVGMKQLTDYKKVKGDISNLMEGLWRRSLRVAVLSFVIAKNKSKLDPENAMLAGLLHDVGKFYILNRAQHYQSLFVSHKELWNMVDAWQSDIGAAILENWEIEPDIRHAVQNFDNPGDESQGVVNLAGILIAADLLDAHFDEKSNQKIDWDSPVPVFLRLAIDKDCSKKLYEESQVELEVLLNTIN